jgi:hypothetical protein
MTPTDKEEISDLGQISDAIRRFERPEKSPTEIVHTHMHDEILRYLGENPVDMIKPTDTHSDRWLDFIAWLKKEGLLVTLKKTYVIYQTEYMHDEPDMYSFQGTWRELLVQMCGWDDMPEDEIIQLDDRPRLLSEFTDEELLTVFDRANGDGQAGYSVFCLEDDKKVLG